MKIRTIRGESRQLDGRGPVSIDSSQPQLVGVLDLGRLAEDAVWRDAGAGALTGADFALTIARLLGRDQPSCFRNSRISFLMFPVSTGRPISASRPRNHSLTLK